MMEAMMSKKPSIKFSKDMGEDEMDPEAEMAELMGEKPKKEAKGFVQMMVSAEEKAMIEKMRKGDDEEVEEEEYEEEMA